MVFSSFARQIALCFYYTCLIHMLPWRCSGRHSNSRGEETTQEGQACAASLHPTDSPEDHVQLLTKSSGTSEGTDPKPSDTESMCSSQEGHKRGQQIKVYIWASFSLPFSFLRFDLIERFDYFTIKIIFTVVKSTSTQSHFVIPHQDRLLCPSSFFRDGKVWTRIFRATQNGKCEWKY